MTWTKHGYGALGALELASIILAWIVIGIGFGAFLTEIGCCLIIFIILVLMSALFTFAIVIFCFIGTQTRYWNDYIGCNAKYDGLLSVWNSVDTYLYSVDSLLCSEQCTCNFNDVTTSLYASNSTTAPYYNLWVKENKTIAAKRFQDCPKIVKEQAYNEYLMANAYYNHTFRDDWFMTYYSHIEDFFKCTGFCGTTYYNGKTRANAKIVKYLFSDLTDGIPEHFGCLSSIMDWVRKTLNAFASCGIFLFLVEMILFVLGCLMLCSERKVVSRKPKQEEEKELKPKEVVEKKKEEKVEPVEKKKEEKVEPVEKKKEEKPEDKKPKSIELVNTSYVPPESQVEEIDLKFNPSVSKQ